ncbi:type II secretion system F family protein [Rodentibacter pneumotropicus]|nr:type II secretion system F family protein [Rodentibacter pneumotropicus]NBH75233.1 type II secretion system F family protein [Rodentibacter pneumotropicus]OOF63214.1 type II secretion system protein F [Rodentibacter pneumotropicus]THA03704.1 type II secretion system F family protein [Rodentibacter pneumotropicus]THA08010.1 type II secretion system F family protein [Rodentibacter pneumotropicus]THA13045.1 type II secretion system F family protein [Rodentibacter pneumotropicus]
MAKKLFYYQGQNSLKQMQRGSIIAESAQQAQFQLMNRGLTNIKLKQNWQLSSKPKNTEISALLNQLSTLLQSAIPLKSSLQILQQNCTQLALNTWLEQILKSIESGLAFSQSIEQQGKYITRQEIQLIQVGEMTGKLATVCSKIAAHRQQSLTLQRKLQKIMLYPSMVLGISLLLTLGLLLFIVPQFAEMYQGNHTELPALTSVLLSTSNFLKKDIGVLLFFTMIFALFYQLKLKHSTLFHHKKSQIITVIPILGNIQQLSRLVNFSQSLYIMLQAGVPLNQALSSFLPRTQTWQTKKIIVSDQILDAEVRSILQWVSQGYAFSDSVSSHLFPMEAQQMLQIGEKSGKLALMLQHISESYQDKLNHQIDLLSQMLEPLMMVIIGSLIGIIMMGMYLPIFNMGSVVQ